jgi:hypothetical protein
MCGRAVHTCVASSALICSKDATLPVHVLLLSQEDMGDVREQLLNQLVLLDPPSFMYAAQPPAADSRRRRRAGGAALKGGEAGLEDDEGMTVFGSYAAVTMCDCR